MTPAKCHTNRNAYMPAYAYASDLFDSIFGNWAPAATRSTAPAINVIEHDKGYRVEVAAPGMTKEDFSVKLNEDGDLVVSMEKKEADNQDGKGNSKHSHYVRREFSFVKFQQTLLLPDDSRREDITARVENGILTIDIPRVEKVADQNRNRQISIG